MLNKAAFRVRLISNILVISDCFFFVLSPLCTCSSGCPSMEVSLPFSLSLPEMGNGPSERKRKRIFKKKEKGREKKSSKWTVLLGCVLSAFTPCFWCTSVKCAARALAHGTQLKSQYFFFYLPRVSTLKQAAGLAGFFPYLSPAHSLAQCAPIHTLLSSRLLRPKT